MKKILSAVLAVAMATGMSVSAFAAGYGSDPDYSNEKESASVSTGAGTTSSNRADTVSSTFVKHLDAVIRKGGDAVVYVTSNSSIDKRAVESIAKLDAPVTFKSTKYSITIDPSSITNPKMLKLGMDMNTTKEGLSIEPQMSGSFGLTMQMSIPTSRLNGMDTSKLRLYYVDNNGVYHDYGAVEVKDGNAVFNLTHASSYVITDKVVEDAVQDGTVSDNSKPNPGMGAASGMEAVAAVAAMTVVAGAAAVALKR